MGIDFSKTGKQDLIDIGMEPIGLFYNENDIIDGIDYPKYSRPLDENENYYYNDVIQCLVNIDQLKNLFLNRKELFNKKIVQEEKKITFSFYKLMQYMWYWEQLKKENEDNADKDQSFTFILEINEIFKDLFDNNNDVIIKIKSFIEYILLSIHYENKLEYKGDKEIYNINEMKTEFYKEDSFIKNNFFFELVSEFKCGCKKLCISKEYMLCLDINNLSNKQTSTVIHFIIIN